MQDRHIDAYALADFLDVTPAIIRKWASRGKIHRYPRDHRGRTLYDVDEVLSYAATLGYVDACMAGARPVTLEPYSATPELGGFHVVRRARQN